MNAVVDVVIAGTGPNVLLIHGSATDRSSWAIQLARLKNRFSLMAPTRLGSQGELVSVKAHAESLASLLREQHWENTIVVGSSFGGVVALELAKLYPAHVRGLVLIEPPLAAHDDLAHLPQGFGCHFDRVVQTKGGAVAAEMFFHAAVGDRASSVPEPFLKQIRKMSAQIRSDCAALARFRTDYHRLRRFECPTLLLGGQRSLPRYGETLEALESVLPNASKRVIAGAGHMLHAEAPRAFANALVEFSDSIPFLKQGCYCHLNPGSSEDMTLGPT